MKRRILLFFIFVFIIEINSGCQRDKKEAGKINSQAVVLIRIVNKDSVERVFSFLNDDIDEVFVVKGAYGDYSVTIILKKYYWKKLEKFTRDNIYKRFEVLLNGQVTNEGTIMSSIDDGEIRIKGFPWYNKEEAENFAKQLSEEIGYRDVQKQQESLINRGMRIFSK